MKWTVHAVGALLVLLSGKLLAAERIEPASLIDRSRQIVLLHGARIDYRFELVSASGAKRLRRVSSLMRTNATGDTTRLARYEFPDDAKGLSTLLAEHRDRDNELWIYIPAVKKMRRLVSDNERDSFLGTVLSYGDVLGYKTAQWQHVLDGEETIDGHLCWHVVSKPSNGSIQRASGYSRRETWITEDEGLTLQMSAWDEASKPLKVVHYRDWKPVTEQPGKWIPYSIEADDLAGGGSTLIAIEHFEFLAEVDDGALSPATLSDEP